MRLILCSLMRKRKRPAPDAYIPKDQGVIDSLNIWFADIHSPLVGILSTSGTDMVIDLRWDDPEMKPFTWNGKYRLSPGYKRAGDGDPKTCFQAE